MKINVDYIGRVEGESSVKLEIEDGRLKDLKLNIWEPPRFFEGFMAGRKFDEIPDIVARICGICPVSHMTTAIRAIEKAMGFAPSTGIKTLRKTLTLSQIIASHLAHLYVLALPDYLGYKSVTEMTKGYEKEIKRFLRLKEISNGITALFGGRALHPVSLVVGGFTKVPSKDNIGKIVNELDPLKEDALETLKLFSSLSYPELDRNTEYVALTGNDDYAVNEGKIASSGGIRADEDSYHTIFVEDEVSHSNAKRTIVKGRGPFMVGALSRVNLGFDDLHPEAKKAALELGFKPIVNNPFHNNTAQAIEIIHAIWELSELLHGLCEPGHGTGDYYTEVKVREGAGSAITEAPRGMLYHYYEVNGRGVIEKANIVTPTAHNFLHIEESLRKLVNENIQKPADELALLCEMLVRAYDPCFSCSVH